VLPIGPKPPFREISGVGREADLRALMVIAGTSVPLLCSTPVSVTTKADSEGPPISTATPAINSPVTAAAVNTRRTTSTSGESRELFFMPNPSI
jgi:hypothetical protein